MDFLFRVESHSKPVVAQLVSKVTQSSLEYLCRFLLFKTLLIFLLFGVLYEFSAQGRKAPEAAVDDLVSRVGALRGSSSLHQLPKRLLGVIQLQSSCVRSSRLLRTRRWCLRSHIVAGQKMDASSSEVAGQEMDASRSRWDEEVRRWSRVIELGMEEGLREAGCSEDTVATTMKLTSAHIFSLDQLAKGLSEHEFAKACGTVLATVGRVFRTQNITFEKVDVTISDAIAFFVNLSTNVHIGGVSVPGRSVFESVTACTLLGFALASNSTLVLLDFSGVRTGPEALRGLLDGVARSKSLHFLNLCPEDLPSMQILCQFLSKKSPVWDLKLEIPLTLEYADALATALAQNTTLEQTAFASLRLDITQVDRGAMERLLEPLTREVGEAAAAGVGSLTNSTLLYLTLKMSDHENVTVDALASMILSNKNLTDLQLHYRDSPTSPAGWKEKIFVALKENETLQSLSLDFNFGLFTEDVLPSLMDVLQDRSSKTRLTRIHLDGIAGVQQAQAQLNEELRINTSYRYALRGQSISPTRSGRIVLCGYPFAGKSAICNTMLRTEHGGSPFPYALKMGWKTLMQSFPWMRQLIFGRDAPMELNSRTRGCDMRVLRKQAHVKSVWDFAGQREYYAFHDYLFPDMKNSCFVYVCSCRSYPTYEKPRGEIKDQDAMRQECDYWMQFLASNSKSHQGGLGSRLPTVIFVLTKGDTLKDGELNTAKQKAETVVKSLQEKFSKVLRFCEQVQVVNSHSLPEVQRLLVVANKILEDVLAEPVEHAVCADIRNALATWSAQHPSKPILHAKEFEYSCEEIMEKYQLETQEAFGFVLAYLNDLGEVIYFKKLGLLVANPRWFGVGVLGSLISTFKGPADSPESNNGRRCPGIHSCVSSTWELHHVKGFVERKHVEDLLEYSLQTMHLKQSIYGDKLIELMIELEMCFETQPGNADSSLFMPALIDGSSAAADATSNLQLEWRLDMEGKLTHLGRRLECEEKEITFLTPGFFPRLQVHLRNFFQEQKWTGIEVGRNVVRFTENGVEVFVEYSGDIDYFVDVLVRSSLPFAETLKFVNTDVLQKIHDFCATRQGCQGVRLVESVIRPVCVEQLHPPAVRKGQAVLVSDLQLKLEQKSESYKHIWRQTLAHVADTDFALDLLEGEGAFKELKLKQQVELLEGEGAYEKLILSREIYGSTEQSGIVSQCGLQDVELPKLFYPSIEDVGVLRKLDAILNVSKTMHIKLHLLCDNKDRPHKVDGQPGRTMKLKWNASDLDVPIAKLAVTLLWAGVVAAARITGAGVALPQVDKWIEKLFTVRGMPSLDVETLQKMRNRGQTPGAPVSEEEILTALERYWKNDPETQGLKRILNVEDDAKFWEDFRLHKVVYTNAPHKNRIGWVCKNHFDKGLEGRILRSRTH